MLCAWEIGRAGELRETEAQERSLQESGRERLTGPRRCCNWSWRTLGLRAPLPHDVHPYQPSLLLLPLTAHPNPQHSRIQR